MILAKHGRQRPPAPCSPDGTRLSHCVTRPGLHLGRLCNGFSSSGGGLARAQASLCLVSMKLMLSPLTPARAGIRPWGSIPRGPVLSFNTELQCDPKFFREQLQPNPPQNPPSSYRTHYWKYQGVPSYICNLSRLVLVPGHRDKTERQNEIHRSGGPP